MSPGFARDCAVNLIHIRQELRILASINGILSLALGLLESPIGVAKTA